MSEVQSGVAQSGNPWYRQTIVVDVAGYNGSFRKVALQASGNVVGDLEGANVGDKVEISYQVTAREWNGKWYNNVDLYKVEFLEEKPQIIPVYPQNPQFSQYPQQPQPQVNPQMYPQTPAPAAPAAPAPRGRRVASTPQIPANTPMDLQEDDLPPSFYQQ
jgi:hypothetical protein